VSRASQSADVVGGIGSTTGQEEATMELQDRYRCLAGQSRGSTHDVLIEKQVTKDQDAPIPQPG